MKQDIQHDLKIWLDQYIVNIIHDAFSYMAENYHMAGVIDHAAWIIQEGELESLLPALAPSDQVVRCISLSPKEYDKFVRLLDYAGYAAPSQKDRAELELIHEAFLEADSRNNRIYAIRAIEPQVLETLVSVFSKMIDEPEAIDSSMYDLTAWPKFLALTNKLKELLAGARDPIILSLTSSEWATYYSYATHVYDLDVKDLSPAEEDIINSLMH